MKHVRWQCKLCRRLVAQYLDHVSTIPNGCDRGECPGTFRHPDRGQQLPRSLLDDSMAQRATTALGRTLLQCKNDWADLKHDQVIRIEINEVAGS